MSLITKGEGNISSLEAVHSIGKSISANLDVEIILQEVTDATTRLTGASFGAFFYNNVDEEGNSFSLYTLSGAPREAFEKFGVPRHTGVFHPTFVDGKVLRVGDITKDSRYGRNSPHSGMPTGHLPVKSYLAVPVVSKSGEVIGGLLLGHPEENIFQKDHEEIVVEIATQAAISLDNSRLFDKVRALSKKKDEFIALASHELKTPLTSVKGYLQILQRKEKDDTSKKFLDKALNEVNKLNNLVEELLHLSRIEAGMMEYEMEVFDLNLLVIEMVKTFQHSSPTHKLLYSHKGENFLVLGDKQRIEQVLLNLLTNAVKYSPEANEVEIFVDSDNDEITVTVKDHGLGLLPNQQVKLFDKFYRAENSKGINGLGLGLYISKQIIERHNGEIGVRSTEKKGSEFFFKLEGVKS